MFYSEREVIFDFPVIKHHITKSQKRSILCIVTVYTDQALAV